MTDHNSGSDGALCSGCERFWYDFSSGKSCPNCFPQGTYVVSDPTTVEMGLIVEDFFVMEVAAKYSKREEA
jgi:hypothetical protein